MQVDSASPRVLDMMAKCVGDCLNAILSCSIESGSTALRHSIAIFSGRLPAFNLCVGVCWPCWPSGKFQEELIEDSQAAVPKVCFMGALANRKGWGTDWKETTWQVRKDESLLELKKDAWYHNKLVRVKS